MTWSTSGNSSPMPPTKQKANRINEWIRERVA